MKVTNNQSSGLESFEMNYEDLPNQQNNRGKSRKVLTKQKRWSIIGLVNKLNERTKNMAKDKNTKHNKLDVLKSIAWLVEAAFRFFVGWVLLSKFHQPVMVAAALYALGSGALIVIAHFIKANR